MWALGTELNSKLMECSSTLFLQTLQLGLHYLVRRRCGFEPIFFVWIWAYAKVWIWAYRKLLVWIWAYTKLLVWIYSYIMYLPIQKTIHYCIHTRVGHQSS